MPRGELTQHVTRTPCTKDLFVAIDGITQPDQEVGAAL